jgi:ferredoxin
VKAELLSSIPYFASLDEDTLASIAATAVRRAYAPDEIIFLEGGLCAPRRPTGALAMQGALAILARPDLCSYCATCKDICPVGAIALPYQIVFASEGHAA